MLIYRALFLNGKSYIGMTSGVLKLRICQHISDAEIRSTTPFHRAIVKYGSKNITWSIVEGNIEDCTYLKEREQFYILKYDTYKPNGYNLSLGGEGAVGYRHTEDAKKRIVKALIGRPVSEKTRRKIGLANSGKSPSKVVRKKMSLAKKGRPVKPEVLRLLAKYAKHGFQSDAHRQAFIASTKGKKYSMERRKSLSRAQDKDLNTYRVKSPEGRYYQVRNLYDFCIKHGLRKERLKAVCIGKVHCKSYQGWVGNIVKSVV